MQALGIYPSIRKQRERLPLLQHIQQMGAKMEKTMV